MINFEALFKISYGIYVVTSGDEKNGNGFISNTVFQVSSEPPRFAAVCNKNNYTAGLIAKSGHFAVSVLHTETSPEIIGRFGFKSGKDLNKLQGLKIKIGETGTPIVLEEAIAFIECKLVQTFDVGTHIMFIGDLVQSEILDDTKEPMTYSHYRKARKGIAPKNAPTYIDKSKLAGKVQEQKFKKYKCTACGFIYNEAEEKVRFVDLPADWVCPVCGTPKEDFIEII
jgi:flavin reductase (DIM6/NTAB) family NADH-FMN oxidoreductase RutF/rubredoxin